MRRALLAVFALVVVGIALTLTPAAAGGGCHDSEGSEASASMVELRNACFTPTVTHVDPGEELAFVNRDGVAHNIIGLGAGWGEPVGMGRDETRAFTFGGAGIFPYACTLHVGMVGAVVVGGDELHAGNADLVSAASLAKPGGPAVPSSTETRSASAEGGPWLPSTALALLVVIALVGGFVMLARRRASV